MRPAVLIFVSYYLPGFQGGGPIRTIANLVEQLGDEFEFKIVSKDRDLGKSHPYENIKVDSWNSVGKAKVFYASPKGYSYSSLKKILREVPYDVLYLNSYFEPIFTFRPLMLLRFGKFPIRPLILAPHGEFSENALRIKKLKKQIFMFFESFLGLSLHATWHASTALEAKDIAREKKVPLSSVKVATNLVSRCVESEQEIFASSIKNKGALRVCFLSRISPMKNLLFALNVLLEVEEKIDFYIYGPIESSEYWSQCERLIKLLPSNIVATYCGSVDPSEVKKVISQHDLFFVPTQGENFGHVFIESFSSGVPVLLSDRTPWRNLEQQGIGWDIPLDKTSAFAIALKKMCNLSDDRRCQMRASCIDFAFKVTEDKETLQMNRNLFLESRAQ